jgi:DnaJ-class molecular chaperone
MHWNLIEVECAHCEALFTVSRAAVLSETKYCPACQFAAEQEAKFQKQTVCVKCNGTGRVPVNAKIAQYLSVIGPTPKTWLCDCAAGMGLRP